MNSLKSTSIFFVLMLFLIISCRQENEIAPKIELLDFSEILSNNLNDIASGLQERGQTFRNSELVNQLSRENLLNEYKIDQSAITSYTDAFQFATSTNAKIKEEEIFSELALNFLSQIDVSSSNAESLNQYLDLISSIELELISSDLKNDEILFIQLKIISLRTSLSFVASNFDLFIPQNGIQQRIMLCDTECNKEQIPEDEGWWSNWGRCAAGTVGGAIGGALTGCATGAVIGALAGAGAGGAPALPAAIIGCEIGGYIGAIGGALSGAAANCD